MKLLGVILVLVGLSVFLGNISGLFPSIPGLGVGTFFIGIILLLFIDRFDLHLAGMEEWRYYD